MKTTVKKLAAGTFIILLLLVGNVKAEGTETKASVNVAETTLQLENWMINEAVWNKTHAINYKTEQVTETGLSLEKWMTSEKTWNRNISIIEEIEPGMQLESWMTNEKVWKTINYIQETEKGLKIAGWMTNNKVWRR